MKFLGTRPRCGCPTAGPRAPLVPRFARNMPLEQFLGPTAHGERRRPEGAEPLQGPAARTDLALPRPGRSGPGGFAWARQSLRAGRSLSIASLPFHVCPALGCACGGYSSLIET